MIKPNLLVTCSFLGIYTSLHKIFYCIPLESVVKLGYIRRQVSIQKLVTILAFFLLDYLLLVYTTQVTSTFRAR